MKARTLPVCYSGNRPLEHQRALHRIIRGPGWPSLLLRREGLTAYPERGEDGMASASHRKNRTPTPKPTPLESFVRNLSALLYRFSWSRTWEIKRGFWLPRPFAVASLILAVTKPLKAATST